MLTQYDGRPRTCRQPLPSSLAGGRRNASAGFADRNGQRLGPAAGSTRHVGTLERIDGLIERGRPGFSLQQRPLRPALGSRSTASRGESPGGVHHGRRHAGGLVFPAGRPTAPRARRRIRDGRTRLPACGMAGLSCVSSRRRRRGGAPGGRPPARSLSQACGRRRRGARLQPNDGFGPCGVRAPHSLPRPEHPPGPPWANPRANFWIRSTLRAMGVPACVQGWRITLDFLAGKRSNGLRPAGCNENRRRVAAVRDGCESPPACPRYFRRCDVFVPSDCR